MSGIERALWRVIRSSIGYYGVLVAIQVLCGVVPAILLPGDRPHLAMVAIVTAAGLAVASSIWVIRSRLRLARWYEGREKCRFCRASTICRGLRCLVHRSGR